jgi:hypothetical protein
MSNFWQGFEKRALSFSTAMTHGAGGALAGGAVGAATADKGKRVKGALGGAAVGGALGALHGHAKVNQGFNKEMAEYLSNKHGRGYMSNLVDAAKK